LVEKKRDNPHCVSFAMKKLGLALSGGGFRASLYHLGLLRFLRDAGLLSQVTHITSVSGGSIMAAHLALNWDRYTDGAKEFDAAAAELLGFVRLDVRNRITRRFPLTLPLRWPRRLLGRSNRRLTRTGLLEYHYERFLYGDRSLFELPEKPQLHILATNLSEGCLCSFTRSGLLMVRRQAGSTFRLDRVHVGLATVAMAVTASSAFPGFFPPLELTGTEVGASAGEFGRQAYTDGGVFDNLGVRMFHCLERPLLAESPLCPEDFVDFQASIKALLEASRSAEETPLRRLAQLVVVACRQPDLFLLPGGEASRAASFRPAIGAGQPESLSPLPPAPGAWIGDNQEAVLSGLWNVMRHYQFRLDPVFTDLKPLEPEAQALLRASRVGGQPLGPGDQLWLNRHLLEAAFRQATGLACFRRLNSGLDGVLVSDVGKAIEVQNNRRAGGLIRTALRATDIVMDRVWQLEIEKFVGAPGFVFAPVTEVVEPAEDPTALHAEMQRQLPRIRTDMDRFSALEISTLARHGYCVGRKACRAHPDLFGTDLLADAPWDPVPVPRGLPAAVAALTHPNGSAKAPTAATADARALQGSAGRRIWSTLLDRRDWVSYVYVPIIIPILCLLPYFAIDAYKRSHRLGTLVHSFAQGTRDLETLNAMLDRRVVPWIGVPAEKVPKLEEPDLTGFDILQDSRIVNLRDWKPGQLGKNGPDSLVLIYRRVKLLKRRENTSNDQFRLVLLPTSPKTQARFPPQPLPARLRMSELPSSAPGREECRWEASFDFHHVPPGDFEDIIMEELSPGQYLDRRQSGSGLTFGIQAPTAELTTWILMPRGMEYENFRIIRHQPGKPGTAEHFRPVTDYLADDFTIIAFKLVGLEPGWEYDVSWVYK
jgi:predicted acylesterase/phospholipase RssA